MACVIDTDPCGKRCCIECDRFRKDCGGCEWVDELEAIAECSYYCEISGKEDKKENGVYGEMQN